MGSPSVSVHAFVFCTFYLTVPQNFRIGARTTRSEVWARTMYSSVA